MLKRKPWKHWRHSITQKTLSAHRYSVRIHLKCSSTNRHPNLQPLIFHLKLKLFRNYTPNLHKILHGHTRKYPSNMLKFRVNRWIFSRRNEGPKIYMRLKKLVPNSSHLEISIKFTSNSHFWVPVKSNTYLAFLQKIVSVYA